MSCNNSKDNASKNDDKKQDSIDYSKRTMSQLSHDFTTGEAEGFKTTMCGNIYGEHGAMQISPRNTENILARDKIKDFKCKIENIKDKETEKLSELIISRRGTFSKSHITPGKKFSEKWKCFITKKNFIDTFSKKMPLLKCEKTFDSTEKKIDFDESFKGASIFIKSEGQIIHQIQVELKKNGKAEFPNFESFFISKANWIKKDNKIIIKGIGSPDRKLGCEWECQGQGEKCVTKCTGDRIKEYGKDMPDNIPITFIINISNMNLLTCDIIANDPKPITGKKVWDYGSQKNITCGPFKEIQ